MNGDNWGGSGSAAADPDEVVRLANCDCQMRTLVHVMRSDRLSGCGYALAWDRGEASCFAIFVWRGLRAISPARYKEALVTQIFQLPASAIEPGLLLSHRLEQWLITAQF